MAESMRKTFILVLLNVIACAAWAAPPNGKIGDKTALMSRVNAEPLVLGTIETINGRPYQRLSAFGDRLQSLVLTDPSDDPRIARANAMLRQNLREQMLHYLECDPEGIKASGTQTVRESGEPPIYRVELTYRDEHWLSWRTTGWDNSCPFYAHPLDLFGHATWNLDQGKTENLWRWVKGRIPEPFGEYALPPALQTIVLSHGTPDSTCLAYFLSPHSAHAFDLSLGTRGMMFSPVFAHVASDCRAEIIVPYAEILPFLNATGKAAVIRILASPAYAARQP